MTINRIKPDPDVLKYCRPCADCKEHKPCIDRSIVVVANTDLAVVLPGEVLRFNKVISLIYAQLSQTINIYDGKIKIGKSGNYNIALSFVPDVTSTIPTFVQIRVNGKPLETVDSDAITFAVFKINVNLKEGDVVDMINSNNLVEAFTGYELVIVPTTKKFFSY